MYLYTVYMYNALRLDSALNRDHACTYMYMHACTCVSSYIYIHVLPTCTCTCRQYRLGWGESACTYMQHFCTYRCTKAVPIYICSLATCTTHINTRIAPRGFMRTTPVHCIDRWMTWHLQEVFSYTLYTEMSFHDYMYMHVNGRVHDNHLIVFAYTRN